MAIRPRDTDSWTSLARVYLDREMWAEAEGALDALYRVWPVDARLYELQFVGAGVA